MDLDEASNDTTPIAIGIVGPGLIGKTLLAQLAAQVGTHAITLQASVCELCNLAREHISFERSLQRL